MTPPYKLVSFAHVSVLVYTIFIQARNDPQGNKIDMD
jgi:hypothetical protein